MKHRRFWWNSIIVLLLLVFMDSCQQSPITASELEEYIVQAENGLIQTVTEEDITMQEIFRPAELLIYQDLRNQKNSTDLNILESRKKYEHNVYVTVNIIQGGNDPLYSSSDATGYAEVLKKLAFRMSEQAALIIGKDTIVAADYNFSPMYNMSGAVSVMFVFKDIDILSADWIQLELHDPFKNTGNKSFRFERKNLEKIPQVKMEFTN